MPYVVGSYQQSKEIQGYIETPFRQVSHIFTAPVILAIYIYVYIYIVCVYVINCSYYVSEPYISCAELNWQLQRGLAGHSS